MKKQILSFKYALTGVWNTVKNEGHMRFHMTAGFYVLLFSSFYGFSAGQTALLVILIAAVLAAETVNTCIEELCNLTADRYDPLVKVAKDAAAGAVLILSIAAAVVAVIFFWNISIILQIINFFADNIFLLVLLVLSAVCSVIFVWLGPVGIREQLLRIKLKLKIKKQ